MITGLAIAAAGFAAIFAGFPLSEKNRGFAGIFWAMLIIAGLSAVFCGVILVASPAFFRT